MGVVGVWCMLLGACAATPAGPSVVVFDDDAPRRIDGRVESTAAVAPPAATRAALLERIAASMAKQHEVFTKFPPPVALCPRVPFGSITIDGRLDEQAWQDVPVITGFHLSANGNAESKATRVRLAWDARYLYVAFDVDDDQVIGTITERDGELWREDAVEVFIDANRDGMSYVEYEVSPRGVFYDAAIADYRPEIEWVKDLNHIDIPMSIAIYKVRDTPYAVHVDGTLNEPGDTDRGWTCEMAISWRDIERGTNVDRPVPRAGDVWHIGLFRINVDADRAEYAAWNPTSSWYHVPRLFGRVVFVE